MEAYPKDYVERNVPYFVLSGVIDEHEFKKPAESAHNDDGPVLSSSLPVLEGNVATRIRKLFQKAASDNRPWNAAHVKDQNGLLSFKVDVVGRTYRLPPKKAGLPAEFDATEPTSPDSAVFQRRILHSPISPLSPDSPLYPDGVMTPLWLAKHQSHLPAVFLTFFSFSSDVSRNSLHDNQLKSEINSMRTVLQTHDYKTRFVVVLISDDTINGAVDVDERLSNIRKACNLDSRSSFFVTPPAPSSADVSSFVLSLLNTLQPIAVEYYRDLTKHTRRKKNRGTIPPPTVAPTRASLDALGWNVRYDFKLGIFAEFRQEMESALRHYQSALESLLSPDGVFETTPSWSPRWNEARLLADGLAIRILRCLLWSSSTTLAAQSWTYYRDRIRELVDRRGKGSSGYAWQAWEATWAKVMAQLIERSDLPIFALKTGPSQDVDNPAYSIYAPVEKTIPVGERIPAWFHLHHPGHWYRAAYRHTSLRRRLAQDLTEEERKAPETSASNSALEKSKKLDVYLCPEPYMELPLPGSSTKGFDHSTEIMGHLDAAIGAFAGRGQRRTAHRLQLELGKEHIRRREYKQSRDVLQSLWQDPSARDEGWWSIVEQIAVTLRDCARQVADLQNLIATSYELCSNVFSSPASDGTDLMTCLSSAKTPKSADGTKPHVSLSARQTAPVLECHAVFSEAESNAGEEALLQVALLSNARSGSALIRMNRIRVTLHGSKSEIIITNQSVSAESSIASASTGFRRLDVQERHDLPDNTLIINAQTDLALQAGSSLILELPITFREAGEVSVSTIFLEIKPDDFKLDIIFESQENVANEWYLPSASGKLRSRPIARETPATTRVLPRPPKMEIQLLEVDQYHYTDEPVTLNFEITNGEDEETEATLEVRLMSRNSTVPAYQWVTANTNGSGALNDQVPGAATPVEDLPGHTVGKLQMGEKSVHAIAFTAPSLSADFVVEAKVLYHLLSDRSTPVSKVFSTALSFASAFEANYDFTPRLHPTPWPSFFNPSTIDFEPAGTGSTSENLVGITHSWRLTARLASFAEETLAIENVELDLLSATNGLACTVTRDLDASAPLPIAPKELHEHTFTINSTRPSLEHRVSSSLDMSLIVTWRRAATSGTAPPAVITTLAVPPIAIPASEPRVLLTAHRSMIADESTVVHLDYSLENPSLHFLTFDLTMEASEHFAFSGPKSSSVNLVPLSRTTVRCNIMPYVVNRWVQPHPRIMDREFGRQLKVLPADGCRRGKDGSDVDVWIEGDEKS